MKAIYLMRHAHAGWGEPGIVDHDRPLDERGWREAVALHDHLHATGIAPDLVLCSSADRARRTLDLVIGGLPSSTRPVIEPDLYLASADALLERLTVLDGATESVMIVGHDPGLSELIALLTGAEPRSIALATASVAHLHFGGDWTDLAPGAATLQTIGSPGSFKE